MKCLRVVSTISKIISLLLIPIIVAFLGHEYNNAQKDKEIKVRLIELAVDVLKTEFKYESEDMKTWAIQIINTYSEIPLSIETEKSLKSITTWPTKEKLDRDYSSYKEIGEQLYKLGDYEGALSYFKDYKDYYDMNFDVDNYIKKLKKKENN